ncbi:unnamed protein product [Lactuca virosa]|uniref:Uncharacterized protein n=1 Tax=Lactuca virosa TaxID=75947 RepID=A0AAU9M5Q7_9ASTR|nr:unnamed protein product [Lactuca virosa]
MVRPSPIVACVINSVAEKVVGGCCPTTGGVISVAAGWRILRPKTRFEMEDFRANVQGRLMMTVMDKDQVVAASCIGSRTWCRSHAIRMYRGGCVKRTKLIRFRVVML